MFSPLQGLDEAGTVARVHEEEPVSAEPVPFELR